MVEISFGRFKGHKLDTVPDWYLTWLAGEIKHAAPNKRTVEQKKILEFVESKKK